MTRGTTRRATIRWERDCRSWAFEAARDLALALYYDRPLPAKPYGVGVVLEAHERPLVEVPMRLLTEQPAVWWPNHEWTPPVRPWLLTTDRVCGRLGDGRLYCWEWWTFNGCHVDLAQGREQVALDSFDGTPLTWSGPGVIPLSVVAVYKLYGPRALVDHPSLEPVRVTPRSA
jgi:hypothetical protein